MEEHVYLITIGIAFGTVVLVFGMRAYASVQQAKARIAAEAAYRQAFDQAASAQAQAAAALAGIQASVSSVETRLASVEKLLKDVG